MSLKEVPVSRSLEKKLQIFGMDALDVFAVALTLSILNLIFGQSGYQVILVWIPTLTLALLLRFGKRGKPEKFLLHWFRYQFKAGIYLAFPAPSHPAQPRKPRSRSL